MRVSNYPSTLFDYIRERITPTFRHKLNGLKLVKLGNCYLASPVFLGQVHEQINWLVNEDALDSQLSELNAASDEHQRIRVKDLPNNGLLLTWRAGAV